MHTIYWTNFVQPKGKIFPTKVVWGVRITYTGASSILPKSGNCPPAIDAPAIYYLSILCFFMQGNDYDGSSGMQMPWFAKQWRVPLNRCIYTAFSYLIFLLYITLYVAEVQVRLFIIVINNTYLYYISSSWHVFTNFSNMNLRIFLHIFLGWKRKQISFWSKSNQSKQTLRSIWWKNFVDLYSEYS